MHFPLITMHDNGTNTIASTIIFILLLMLSYAILVSNDLDKGDAYFGLSIFLCAIGIAIGGLYVVIPMGILIAGASLLLAVGCLFCALLNGIMHAFR